MKIAIGNDHTGVELKHYLIAQLEALGHTVVNVGTNDATRTHSAIYATAVAGLINQGDVDLGILICGTGLVCLSVPTSSTVYVLLWGLTSIR